MSTGHNIKIAVCDDKKTECIEIAGMTKKVLKETGIFCDLSIYDNAGVLLADIKRGEEFQVILLDAVMDKMSGMDLAVELRKQKHKAAMIFISGDREMVFRGYEVSAVRYLEKPVNEAKLKEALGYCCGELQEVKEILIPTVKGKCRITLADVQYVEAFDRGSKFVLTEEVVESRLKFSEALKLLPSKTFIQCHRAYIVNLSYVKYIRNYEFELKNELTVSIGKARYPEIYKQFVNYVCG